MVAYYQQVGRAGRALDAAYGVLLSGEEETDITDYFIESAFPTRAEVNSVLEALEAAPAGLSVPELLARVNLSKGRIEKTIALLSLESPAPIAKQGTKWQLTAANLSEAFWQRAERLTDAAPRRAAADAGLREPCLGPYGVPHSGFGRESGHDQACPRYRRCRRRSTRHWCGRRWPSCAAPACRSSRASNGRPAECRSIGLSGRIARKPSGAARQGALRLGGCRMGQPGAPGQVPGPALCRRTGGGLRATGARVEPATGARLGDLRSVASTSRSGAGLRPAAGRGI